MKTYGTAPRAPSAGVVSRAVHGAGKLSAGWHELEVLATPEYHTHRVVLLQNPAGHVHSEAVEAPLPAWLLPGTRVRARIGVGPGFVVVRDVDRLQARDSATREPITEWHTDVKALYDSATAAGSKPATTVLVEVTHDGQSWQPVLHVPNRDVVSLPEAGRPTDGPAPGPDPAAPRAD